MFEIDYQEETYIIKESLLGISVYSYNPRRIKEIPWFFLLLSCYCPLVFGMI